MSYLERVATKIRKMRAFKALSQEYVAAQLEISPRQYQRIESGQCDLSLRRLEEISQVLEVEPPELLGMDEKYVLENSRNSGFGQGFTHNPLTEQLLTQYQEQIKQLKEEVAFLRKRLERT
jgi:transcriptional regulator with XRE-family HTH domain